MAFAVKPKVGSDRSECCRRMSMIYLCADIFTFSDASSIRNNLDSAIAANTILFAHIIRDTARK